jgi:hypothetical protein
MKLGRIEAKQGIQSRVRSRDPESNITAISGGNHSPLDPEPKPRYCQKVMKSSVKIKEKQASLPLERREKSKGERVSRYNKLKQSVQILQVTPSNLSPKGRGENC